MNTGNGMIDESEAYQEWIGKRKSGKTKEIYAMHWRYWLEFCKEKGLPTNGDALLEKIRNDRQNKDEKAKYRIDDAVYEFFLWLQKTKKASQSSALTATSAPRSFFKWHRYSLNVRDLPSLETVKTTYTDHAFDIYQLRQMFAQGDMKQRTILACGKDLWLRAEDFTKIPRELIETAIKREEEKAESEKREVDIIEFEIQTAKEGVLACCHLSRETVELLKEYLKTTPKTKYLFPMEPDNLTYILETLAKKAQITTTGRVRWHCLRKFGITTIHGKVEDPVLRYMTGKKIDKSLRVYIQKNNEPFKAFKLVEPLISLSKSNGGSSTLSKQLEELKETTFKQMALMKLLEKVVGKKEMEKAIMALAKEFGIEIKVHEFVGYPKRGKPVKIKMPIVKLEDFVSELGKKIEKQELERILNENGNGE